MPYINFHNLTKEQVIAVSKDILDNVAIIAECPVERIAVCGIDSFLIINNELQEDVCFVRVEWFKRDEEKQQKVAKLIGDSLKKLGILKTSVTFVDIDGKHDF